MFLCSAVLSAPVKTSKTFIKSLHNIFDSKIYKNMNFLNDLLKYVCVLFCSFAGFPISKAMRRLLH